MGCTEGQLAQTRCGHYYHGLHALRQQMVEVNKELLMTLTGNKPTHNFQVERRSGKHVPLNFDSDPEQVTIWLNTKGFSSQTVKCLGILNGAQLFSLEKKELNAVCGDEGSRVYSQITVQKAQLEKSSGDSELQEIMKRRQEKIDSGLN